MAEGDLEDQFVDVVEIVTIEPVDDGGVVGVLGIGQDLKGAVEAQDAAAVFGRGGAFASDVARILDRGIAGADLGEYEPMALVATLEQNAYNVTMSDDQKGNTELDPRFFEGRLMIDILAWDWDLRLAINSETMRKKARFQGLDYGRDFIIRGCIRAPGILRGKTIKVILSPFGPKIRFGRGGLQQVGRLMGLPQDADFDFEATLMLPEEAIPTTATSLASIWKHLQVLTVHESPEGADISSYFFEAEIHPNLRDWANAD